MLLHALLLRLVQDGLQDVGEHLKLVVVPYLHAERVQIVYLGLPQLENDGDSLEAVTHELRQVVEEMVVDVLDVALQAGDDGVKVEEYLLQVLLDHR